MSGKLVKKQQDTIRLILAGVLMNGYIQGTIGRELSDTVVDFAESQLTDFFNKVKGKKK